jgi:hypothetical protein
MAKAVATKVVTPEAAAPAEETPAKPAKAPKRFWYIVDESGERIERDGKMPKIHGKNPFQAVQKAVTRYATDLDKEYEFMLREAKGKPTKAGKLRVYKYKGWKTELADGEGSEFTKNHSITSKPHAKSLGVTLIDAPVKPTKAKKVKASPEQAKEEVTSTEAPKKKRAGKAKASPEAKTEVGAEPPKKKRAGKGKASPEEKAQ